MTASTKTTGKTDNNADMAVPDDLERQFQQWLTEHQAGIIVFMISPSGVPVPLPDCLNESFRKWQIGIKPVANSRNGDG